MKTIILTSNNRYGKNGETVEVEDGVAMDLLSRGSANNVPVVAKMPHSQPVNRMEVTSDAETIKKRGTKKAVIGQP